MCSKSHHLCVISENGKCSLIIPQKNLITDKENEPVYYGRIADEFIRYSRIKSFMFQPQFFLSFGNINYNLRENEIIMIQSSLTQEYFETLIPAAMNSYVKSNTYDEVEPIIGQIYDNTISNKSPPIKISPVKKSVVKNKIVVEEEEDVNQEEKPAPFTEEKEDKEITDMCKPTVNSKVSSSLWGKCFSKNFKELEFNNLSYCTFTFISHLIEEKTHTKVSINQLKSALLTEYKKYFPRHFNKIIDILILEGKKKLGERVEKIGQQLSERDKKTRISFDEFIMDESYFLTPFDMWLLVQKYKTPSIFLSKTVGNLLETNDTSNLFLGYGFEGDSFAFIIIPGLRAENVPGFKYILTNNEELFIPIESIRDNECRDKIEQTIQTSKSIYEMLDSFMKKTKNKPGDEEEELLVPKKKETRGRKPNLVIEEKVSPILEVASPVILNVELPKSRKNNKPANKTNTKKASMNVNKRKLLIIQDEVEP